VLFCEQLFVWLRHKFLYHKIPKQGCHFFNPKSIEDYYEEDDDEDIVAPEQKDNT